MGLCVFLLNRGLGIYLQSEVFRRFISRQTSLALKVQGKYAPIHRTGFLTVTTAGFSSDGGDRMIKALDAQQVTATLNGRELFHRRCELQQITIARGRVELQPFEPKPPPVETWFKRLLPTVVLREVLADSADVLTKLHGRPAEIRGLKLRIRSNGVDFDYEGHDGFLRMPPLPELQVRHVHMLVTTSQLYLRESLLTPLSPESKGTLTVEGDTGTGTNNHFNTRIAIDGMPLAPWVGHWHDSIDGLVSGHLTGQGTLERKATGGRFDSFDGSGDLQIVVGRIHGLPTLDQLAALTGNQGLRDLPIEHCQFHFAWKHPHLEVRDFTIKSKGVFRLEGNLTVHEGQLAGLFEFGVTPPYLHWLPNARETVFSREHDGYCWTTVRMSGDLKHPKDDLTPRLKSTLAETPFAFMSLLLRGIGDWFEYPFGHNDHESPPQPVK